MGDLSKKQKLLQKFGSFIKNLLLQAKKEKINMKTIAIDSNIYKRVESYAKLNNISVTAAIEKAISLFLQKVQPKQRLLETDEFRDALSYVKTLKAKGGKLIPADENSLDALVDKYNIPHLSGDKCRAIL